MGRDDQLVFFDDQVDDRQVGQAGVQLHPLGTIVERHVDAVLRGGVQQALTHRIFTHRMHIGIVAQSVDDLRPALPVVVGLPDVGRLIVEQGTPHRNVGAPRRKC